MAEPRELYALGDKDWDGTSTPAFIRVRQLEPSEYARIRYAQLVLNRMTENSGLAALRAAQREFDTAVGGLLSVRGTADVPSRLPPVQREFKGWLSAFRAFDDQTSAWLSTTFGRDSALFAEFKSALSAEYDANFAYRLAATLRNASEHVDSVINRLSVHMTEAAVGVQTNTATLELDGPNLCETFPKLKASVRHELSASSKPLRVWDVMGAASLSCERVHARLLLAMWDELEAAASLCDDLHAEAVAAGGGWAAFVDARAFNPAGGHKLHFEYSPKDRADLVRKNKEQAEQLLARVPLHVELRDLT